jgi:hypothetical protein
VPYQGTPYALRVERAPADQATPIRAGHDGSEIGSGQPQVRVPLDGGTHDLTIFVT